MSLLNYITLSGYI